ncbi:MAG: DUF86 domain-containing protein [Firmicutes bacterium]|nr:DUF86 domain-containing protein [Bacillota bacterium]
MNERDHNNIERIKEELRFINKTLADKSKVEFLKDDVIQHAISMSLITIGECANHLSDEFKKRHSHIEWIQVIAVRNIAAHGYWQLNMEQIWQAMEEDIPELCKLFIST